ncbi:MAG: hypothetical protein ACI9XP_001575 [Lentimonas sp.]|jgi:hypothetical protein
MKNSFLIISILATVLLTSCQGSDKVEVGNKTSMQVEQFFDAGEVIKGEKVMAEFTIINTGNFPLVVSAINGSCTCTVVDKPEDPIMPGKKFLVKATVDTERTGLGAIAKGITIVANTEPSLTQVVIKAMVKNK